MDDTSRQNESNDNAVNQLPSSRPIVPQLPAAQNNFTPEFILYVGQQVSNILEYFIASALSIAVFLILKILPEFYPPLAYLAALCIWIVFYIFRTIEVIREHSSTPSNLKRCHRRKDMASFLMIIMTIAFLMMKALDFEFCNVYSIILPLLISYCVNLICFEDSGNKCLGVLLTIKVVISFFRLITLFMILLRTEYEMNDNWSTAIWYYCRRFCFNIN